MPPKLVAEEHHCRYLSRFERHRIAALSERGHGVRDRPAAGPGPVDDFP
jgi:hypothetical protein